MAHFTRNDLKAWHNGDNLVLAVAGANANTIVVVNTVGQINMEPWINHVNVTGVLWAGLPGQEAGNSLVDVLYGVVNVSKSCYWENRHTNALFSLLQDSLIVNYASLLR